MIKNYKVLRPFRNLEYLYKYRKDIFFSIWLTVILDLIYVVLASASTKLLPQLLMNNNIDWLKEDSKGKMKDLWLLNIESL